MEFKSTNILASYMKETTQSYLKKITGETVNKVNIIVWTIKFIICKAVSRAWRELYDITGDYPS
jgi:hypothetical protein